MPLIAGKWWDSLHSATRPTLLGVPDVHHLRCDYHRRGPQWPRRGRLSGPCRPQRAGARHRELVGGCAVTEELWPGFKVSTAAYVNSLFRPEIIRDLELKRHGFEMLPRSPSSFTPLPDGRYLLMGPQNGDDPPGSCQVLDQGRRDAAQVRGDAGTDRRPYRLAKDAGTLEENKQRYAERCIEIMNDYAPNFRRSVLNYQVLSPADLEVRYGLTGGNIMQGTMSLSSLSFMRPVPGYADYRTPVKGLYLCGAATHPGGGVMGACGYNAAREILKDR